jgi:hypothetical protein
MMIKENSKHKSPYHEAYAIIGELKKRPNDPRLIQLALRVIFGIIISDPESTATQGKERDVIYTGFEPSFRFESAECRDMYGVHGKYALINGGRMQRIDDPDIPYLKKYVSLAASNGRAYRCFRMSMRRFLANVRSIDKDSSISAYCMLRGIDLRYKERDII